MEFNKFGTNCVHLSRTHTHRHLTFRGNLESSISSNNMYKGPSSCEAGAPLTVSPVLFNMALSVMRCRVLITHYCSLSSCLF